MIWWSFIFLFNFHFIVSTFNIASKTLILGSNWSYPKKNTLKSNSFVICINRTNCAPLIIPNKLFWLKEAKAGISTGSFKNNHLFVMTLETGKHNFRSMELKSSGNSDWLFNMMTKVKSKPCSWKLHYFLINYSINQSTECS